MANISEAFHRNSTRDFMRFLDYSRPSIAETLSHCYVGLDQEYIGDSDLTGVKEQADLVWRKINSFISYLNRVSQTKKRQGGQPTLPGSKAPNDSTNGTNKNNETYKTNGTV
jgi:hypothetical protein